MSGTALAVRAVHRSSAPWPYGEGVEQLRPAGWRPTPIRDVVLKVHQRCNLACSYCYVYTEVDQSWRDRPPVMSREIWRAALANLGRHLRKHNLTTVRVILHGGEPLLLGAARLAELATDVRASAPVGCVVEILMQTNGVRLNAAMMETLREHRIVVGVSVDGPPADHDKYRVTHSGRGSFAAVRAALDLLRRPENGPCYGGVLCTVSPEVDPVACYDQLAEFAPPIIDFLLPHTNWRRPPARSGPSATPFGDWLVAAFDRWYGSSARIRVRLFEDIITLLLGGASRSEQVGLSPSTMLVVESDGSIEQVDALKSAYEGACATGLDVRRDEFDAALEDPGIIARQIGRAALSPECSRCPIMPICGGGHYAHRYRPDSGYRNRSVYCEDMKRLIRHIRDRVERDVEHRISIGAS